MNDNNIPMPKGLRIWQQNCNASNIAQQDVLSTLHEVAADIVCLQEPYINPGQHTPANSYWRTVYPPTHGAEPQKTRSVIFVHTRLPTDYWQIIPIPHHDITAIRIQSNTGNITIINIYNDCNNDRSIHKVRTYMAEQDQVHHVANAPQTHYVWAGDFNRHYAEWEDERNNHLLTSGNVRAAEILLDLTTEYGMAMTLPPRIPTLQSFVTGNYTRPNNIFVSDTLTAQVVTCNTKPGHRPPRTDHLPILTEIDIQKPDDPFEPRRNFCDVDWEQFGKTLKQKLANLPFPREIETEEEFNQALQNLHNAISMTVDDTVSFLRPCPYSKRWWSSDLTTAHRERKTLNRQCYRNRHNPDHPAH